MEQTDSAREGYRRTTLTNGSEIYVNDFEEYALMAFGAGKREKIGYLPWGWFGGSGIYSIPGQPASAYVLEFDPMYEIVYRNVEHPPFDWRAADFRLMRLYLRGNAQETTDPNVMRDVLAALSGEAALTVPVQADGNYAGFENYTLMSFSDELPGMGYVFGVHIAADGAVYLAENSLANRWFAAGSIIADWVDSP